MKSLTMVGMVLARCPLVDDGIGVVENVERVMEEEKLSPKDATRRSMTEITGALVGIALGLSAVCLPMALFRRPSAVVHRSFSRTHRSAQTARVVVAVHFPHPFVHTLLTRR